MYIHFQPLTLTPEDDNEENGGSAAAAGCGGGGYGDANDLQLLIRAARVG